VFCGPRGLGVTILNPLAWAPMILALSLIPLGLLVFERDRAGALATCVICAGLAALSLVPAAGLAWLFRDGMGPDSVPSSGWNAMGRFWEGFWLQCLLALGVVAAAVALCRRRIASLRSTAVE